MKKLSVVLKNQLYELIMPKVHCWKNNRHFTVFLQKAEMLSAVRYLMTK